MRYFKSLVFIGVLGIFFLAGYTADAAEKSVKSNCTALGATGVSVSVLDENIKKWFFAEPKGMKSISDTCFYSGMKSGRVVLNYANTPYRPAVYTWNTTSKTWERLVTTMHTGNRTATADYSGSSGVFAVFVEEKDLQTGKSSWYRDRRYEAGGATHLYPLGTMLKVTNTSTGKSVVVKVVSTWANSHPGRIIDLTSTAFEKIGKLSAGIAPVTIERIENES